MGNCGSKVFVPTGCDELKPIKLGGKAPDTGKITHYFEGEKIIQVVASHIHSAAVSEDGKLFTFGCGSDGRLGQDGFFKHGRKNRLKFYQHIPTPIETLVRENVHISFAASGRMHMICIGEKK